MVALLFLCLGFAPAWADDAPAPEAPAASDTQAVSAFTNNLGRQALAIITGKGVDVTQKRQQLEALFEKNVAIDWIGRFVLGRYWRDATDAQKQQYLASYKTFLITHYTSNFTDFTDANFDVTRVVPDAGGGSIVTMRLKRPQAEDIIVDYTIRHSEDGGLKVYDIRVEGVSLITTQRSEFASVVSQKGLDYLIAQLAERSKTEDKTVIKQ